MQSLISQRANKLTSSAIREILKVTERPDVISFAGGLPSTATFPIERVRRASERVLTELPAAALQYGSTEGLMSLREWIAARHSTPAHAIAAEQVLITTGSQQALDLLAKVCIDPESPVLVETPTYLGALQAFSLFEPKFVSVASDDDGIIPDAIDATIARQARFLYCLPNYQNPTGRRMPLPRRRELMRIAQENSLLVVEDDPYGALSYDGEVLPSLRSLNPQQVIYLGSFSKVLAPGLRLGYVIAPPAIHLKLVQAKQAADLHTSTLAQHIASEMLRDDFLDDHIVEIRKLYAAQCEVMLSALARHFPPEVTWNRPKGGMFIWVVLPENINSHTLLEKAVADKVAFVPGAPFYAEEPRFNTLRLSFVTVPPAQIEAGVKRLGALIRQEIAQ